MGWSSFLNLENGRNVLKRALSISTGSGDANKIVMTGIDGKLDQSLLPAASNTGFGFYYLDSLLTIPVYRLLVGYQEIEIAPSGELDILGEFVLLE